MEHAGEDAEYIDTYKTSGGNEVLAVLISGEIFVDFFESFDCDADSPSPSLAGFFEGQNLAASADFPGSANSFDPRAFDASFSGPTASKTSNG